MIPLQALRVVCPQSPDAWVAPLEESFSRFGITTELRIAHFLAQVAVESAQFTRLDENLNYSAARLLEVWPSHFKTLEQAALYAGNPHKLGDFVYANRNGNGPESSGDGYKYRGRGLIGTTFLEAYRGVQATLQIPVVACPDILCTKGPAALAAGLFWDQHKLNALADKDDIAGITHIVTGSATGLASRQKYLTALKAAFGEMHEL